MMQKLAKNIYLDFLGIRSSLLTPAEMSLDVKKLFLNLEELFLIPEMSVGRPRDREKIVNQRKMNQRIFFSISIHNTYATLYPATAKRTKLNKKYFETYFGMTD